MYIYSEEKRKERREKGVRIAELSMGEYVCKY